MRGGKVWSDLDEVVLVGGSTRMPQVKNAIVAAYGKQPITRNITSTSNNSLVKSRSGLCCIIAIMQSTKPAESIIMAGTYFVFILISCFSIN